MKSRFGYGAGCRCGGPPTIVSEPCQNCAEGTTPAQVQVQVPPLTNSSCAECADWQGTYILTQQPGNACYWFRAHDPDLPCGQFGLNPVLGGFSLQVTGTAIVFRIEYNQSLLNGDIFEWLLTSIAPTDCQFTGLVLPFNQASLGINFCSGVGVADAIITAL